MVFLGNGDGTFQGPITTNLPNPPLLADGLAPGDFNNDGKSDLALTAAAPQQGAGTVQVLISTGDGTFQPPVSYPTTVEAWKVLVADFDGDGKLDLVTSGFSVLLGNGDGTFQAERYITHSGCGSDKGFVVGDFNGDGKDDFAGSGVVELSNGEGTFTAVCNNISYANVVADVNNDGIPDLVTFPAGFGETTGASICLGKGDGTFQAPMPVQSSLTANLIGNGAAPIIAADLNGNGKIDLAGPAMGNNVTVLLGNGDGTFPAPLIVSTADDQLVGFAASTFITADLRNDGISDFLLFGQTQIDGNGWMVTLLGNGIGGFQPPVAFSAGGMTFAGAAGDFNNDGKVDVAAITFETQVAVLLGNGDGTFQGAAIYSPTAQPTAIGVGDFNGDGNLDIVVPGEVFLGNGDGTFGFPIAITGGGVPMAVGDVNGDGKPDIVSASTNAVATCLNNGSLTFQCTNTPTSMTPTALAIADLNHDGKLDVAAGVGNSVLILLGNGDGTFQSKATFAVNGSPNSIAIADLNGDGILDLGVGNAGVSVLVGNGDGSFQTAITYDDGGGNVVASDFNGDGKIDLAAFNTGGIGLLFNGTAPKGIGLGIPAGGSSSATVAAGSTATYTLSIGGGGLSGTATLTCTGAPTGAKCSVPSRENVIATTASTFKATVTTTAMSVAVQQKSLSFAWLWAAALVGMVWLPVGRGFRGFARRGAAISSLLLVMFLASCGGGGGGGGGSGGTGGTPAGTYTLTVKATMGSTTQSQTLKLTVN